MPQGMGRRHLTPEEGRRFRFSYQKLGLHAFHKKYFPDMGADWVRRQAKTLGLYVREFELTGWYDVGEVAQILGLHPNRVKELVYEHYDNEEIPHHRDSWMLRHVGGRKDKKLGSASKLLISERWLDQEIELRQADWDMEEESKGWFHNL